MEKIKARKAPQMKQEYKSSAQLRAESVIMPPVQNDPFGSYTGKPLVYGERPVQDADDL